MPKLLRRRPTADDATLVARFRAGDEAAFEAIVERHRERLLRYAAHMLRARGPHAAEDVVQDTLIRAHDHLRRDDRPMQLRAWLYRIAHNRCLDELRRPPAAEAEPDEQLSTRPSPFEQARGREQLRGLVADIGSLPANQRSALIIRELDGASYEEIAQALGVSVSAVKSLLVRARVALAEAAQAREAGLQVQRAPRRPVPAVRTA